MEPQVHISTHPLVQHKMALLRDQRTDPKLFRELMREIACLIAYEALADLETDEYTVVTPLGVASGQRIRQRVGLVPILRAGLGMLDGVLQLLPNAEVWHIGLLRDQHTLEAAPYYARLPMLPTVDICLILDPMLATGGSAIQTADRLKQWGVTHIKFLGVIASAAGVQRMTQAHPDVPLYLAAVDAELNEAGLIVPGLGDAGDRLYGTG